MKRMELYRRRMPYGCRWRLPFPLTHGRHTISVGYNIAGKDVEDALLSHPKVSERSVVGVPDVERG